MSKNYADYIQAEQLLRTSPESAQTHAIQNVHDPVLDELNRMI